MTKNTVIIGVAIVTGIISPETEAQPRGRGDAPVSYTHLTLPTKA